MPPPLDALSTGGAVGAALALLAAWVKRQWSREDKMAKRVARLEQALWIAAKHLPEEVEERVHRAMFPAEGGDT